MLFTGIGFGGGAVILAFSAVAAVLDAPDD